MVTADMAQVAYTANVAFRCFRPRSYFYPVGLSTMGYALPAAIGAKLAAPDRAAVALTGRRRLPVHGRRAGHGGGMGPAHRGAALEQ